LLDESGHLHVFANERSASFVPWQNVRPLATDEKADGDNRINSFGVGGEIELRTGTHVVKQPINAPVVHFGLGERKRADVLRIVWPNGTFQAEFDTPIDKAVKAVQRLGFPAGKNKTMLIRLDGLDESRGSGVARRFRLRTNMEVYWDWLAYGLGRDDAAVKRRELAPQTADLRFRGIVAMTQANRSSPELPDYDQLVSVGQHWRDLIGYHTRHGDIRELLAAIDDRYAIVTAGDEIVLKFAAPPEPAAGWKRDFVWISDGWVKDGDYNTRFGKTVLPLPAHGMNKYTTPPGKLEDDRVFRHHRQDWQNYHTRYITPHVFEQGLRRFRPGQPIQRGKQTWTKHSQTAWHW